MSFWIYSLFTLYWINILISAELVYLEDTNFDHEKRNFNFGLPENLKFRMKYKGGDVNLDLRENTRLNVNAPIYEHRFDKERKMRAVRNNKIRPNNVS